SLLSALGGPDAAESSGAIPQLPAPEATREASPPYPGWPVGDASGAELTPAWPPGPSPATRGLLGGPPVLPAPPPTRAPPPPPPPGPPPPPPCPFRPAPLPARPLGGPAPAPIAPALPALAPGVTAPAPATAAGAGTSRLPLAPAGIWQPAVNTSWQIQHTGTLD